MRPEDIFFIFEEDDNKTPNKNDKFLIIRIIEDLVGFIFILLLGIFIAAFFSDKAITLTASIIFWLYIIRVILKLIILIKKAIKHDIK